MVLVSKRRLPPLFQPVTNSFTQKCCAPKTDESEAIAKKSGTELKRDTKLVNLLRNAVEASSDDSGWAQLGPVGSKIAKQSPEFDSRNYGYGKLGELVKATMLFDIEARQIGATKSKALYLRIKRKK